MHPPFAANSTQPGLVQRVDLVCMHPNGVGSSSLLYSDPSVGWQVISEGLDELEAVYGAADGTPQICIFMVCIRCADCQQAELHSFPRTLCATSFTNAHKAKSFFI